MLTKALLTAFFSFIFLSYYSLYAAQVLIGDAKNNETFTFDIATHGFYIPGGRFFVGAATSVSNNEYAVAAAHRSGTTFKPLAPQKVRLNGQPDMDNPLFGSAVNYLTLAGARPLVASADIPSSLFLIEDAMPTISVYAAQDIHDAQGNTASSLLGIMSSAPEVVVALEPGASMAAFAAIGNANGGFDGDGSGIALLFFKKFTNKEKNTPFFVWDIVNAQTGASQFNNEGEPLNQGNQAFPLDKTTQSLAINNPVSSIGNVVDLFFDRDLGKLYIALQIVGGPGPTDGARAVVVASLINGRLFLQPIAQDSAFADNTKIVGGVGPLAQTAIFKVRTMQTTTYLRYLVVVGGNGDAPSLGQSVFALPLVDNRQDAAHGTLASMQSNPLTIFGENPPYRFFTRVFTTPATAPSDLYSMNSPGAQVGGSSTLPGAITDITVSGDAIFVSVDEDGNGLRAGIFYSQALFDTQGRINGWTAWQRVAGTQEKIAGFSYDPYKGEFWYLPEWLQAERMQETGPVQTNTVLRTEFTTSHDALSSFISREFYQSTGGVQGLFDFPVTTPSFTTAYGSRLAVNAFTGFQKVVFMQTGADTNTFFGPQRITLDVYTSENGTLQGFSNQPTLLLSGGAIGQIGPISSCAVLTDGLYGWFVIGGSEGVAILADDQGQGWDAAKGLQTKFQGLTQSMAFKKISGAKNVRKLIAINNLLFVLTDRTVERLTISASSIAASAVTSVVIAQLNDEQKACSSSYSDLIVSGPLALLATSFGLFRSGNLVDVQTVANTRLAGWTLVTLPESAGSFTAPGPVSRLFAISPDGFETSVANGGTVFALNAYVGLDQVQIYRLSVQVNDLVTDDSVTLFPDLFIRNMPTFFANLGNYRNYVVTDGSLIAVSRSAFGRAKPLLELLPPTLKSGQPQGARSRVSFINVQESPGFKTLSMGKLLRDSASGSWMVPGDFGVRIQQ